MTVDIRQWFKVITALFMGLLMTAGVQAKTNDHSHHQHMNHNQSAISWTEAPLLAVDKKRTRGFKGFTLKGMQAEEVTIYPGNTEESWSIEVKDNAVKVKNRGGMKGGYHWIGTVSEQENLVRSVSSAFYFPNPGPAPRDMLSLQKSALDISPVKLPREHQHFRAGENWDFLVRLNGNPVANIPVIFETENQTRKVLKTDRHGLVSIPFPYDFPEESESESAEGHGQGHGHARRKKAGFVLTVEQDKGGKQFVSHFNFHYTTGAFYNKNLALGIGFAVFGMMTAAPLLRKPKKGGKS